MVLLSMIVVLVVLLGDSGSFVSAVPEIYVGAAFNMTDMADSPSLYNFVRQNSFFHNHPVGWRTLSTEQKTKLLQAFTTDQATLESDICCARKEVDYITEMRSLKPTMRIPYFTNNIDKKVYVDYYSSPVKEGGYTYANSPTMWSYFNELVSSFNVQMLALWTVWNTADPKDPVMNAWLHNDTYWEDTVARSFGVVHDWPGSFVDWPHNSPAWILRWDFYRKVYNVTKEKYKKKVFHYFTISTDKLWDQTQAQIREIEDAQVTPDAWIVGNFGGFYPTVPEVDSTGNPAKTLTGFAWWLIHHIRGSGKGESLDAYVRLNEGEEEKIYFKGTKAFERGDHTLKMVEVREVTLVIRNEEGAMDFIPSLRFQDVSNELKVYVDEEDVSNEVRMNKRLDLSGSRRLWPGEVQEMLLICPSSVECSVDVAVYCHPQADVVLDMQDRLAFHFVEF